MEVSTHQIIALAMMLVPGAHVSKGRKERQLDDRVSRDDRIGDRALISQSLNQPLPLRVGEFTAQEGENDERDVEEVLVHQLLSSVSMRGRS